MAQGLEIGDRVVLIEDFLGIPRWHENAHGKIQAIEDGGFIVDWAGSFGNESCPCPQEKLLCIEVKEYNPIQVECPECHVYFTVTDDYLCPSCRQLIAA